MTLEELHFLINIPLLLWRDKRKLEKSDIFINDSDLYKSANCQQCESNTWMAIKLYRQFDIESGDLNKAVDAHWQRRSHEMSANHNCVGLRWSVVNEMQRSSAYRFNTAYFNNFNLMDLSVSRVIEEFSDSPKLRQNTKSHFNIL
jgi:hypothetical protein